MFAVEAGCDSGCMSTLDDVVLYSGALVLGSRTERGCSATQVGLTRVDMKA